MPGLREIRYLIWSLSVAVHIADIFFCISWSDPAAKAQAAAAPQIVCTPHLRTDLAFCHPFFGCERFSFEAEILKEKKKISHTSSKQGPGLLPAFFFVFEELKRINQISSPPSSVPMSISHDALGMIATCDFWRIHAGLFPHIMISLYTHS